MTTKHWTDELVRLGACDSGVAWARRHESIEAAWAACEDGGMMLWYAARVSGRRESAARKHITIAACDCAETVLHMYETAFPGDHRPRTAINVARSWARGDGATAIDVRAATVNAGRAVVAAAAYADADADAAAAYAAYAASAYADADAAAAYAAASSDARRRIVAVIRSHYPTPPEVTV